MGNTVPKKTLMGNIWFLGCFKVDNVLAVIFKTEIGGEI